MKALEFESKIKNNSIKIPVNLQAELNSNREKSIRVIVLFEDSEFDDIVFKKNTKEQFLKGYADSDSIYDKDL